VANFFQPQERRVIPNWRSFRKTTILGELDALDPEAPRRGAGVLLTEYLENWEQFSSIMSAADLVSAALVNGHFESAEVISAADYLLANPQVSTTAQRDIARSLKRNHFEKDSGFKLERITSSDLHDYIKRDIVVHRIKEAKIRLRSFPNNAILWVELSRYYSILGQAQQAIRAMEGAIQLAPHNRFVVRSAVRLFTHFNDLDLAQNVITKSGILTHDPWVLSADIALATLRGRNSRHIKAGLRLVDSTSLSPFSRTELASALGTVQLIDGTLKQSRKLFQFALIAPNDNSLAQAEWAVRKEPAIGLDVLGANARFDFEASALEAYQQGHFAEALDFTAQWFLDMPFARRPVMLGSHIASTLLNRQDVSVEFLQAGLVSHPNDPQIVNNLAYALALDNKADEAFNHLKRVRSHAVMDETTRVCLLATRGLAHFRKGTLDAGRRLYQEAIEESNKLRKPYFTRLAMLNYAREEVMVNSEFVPEVMELVGMIPDDAQHEDLRELKHQVVTLFQERKER
jgi:tetratricopeptide (TPR) repeat protein